MELKKNKDWKEGEMLLTFNITRIDNSQTPLMKEWLEVEAPLFTPTEQEIFEDILLKATKKISSWSEEDLKMKFISKILDLGNILEEDNFVSFFDKKLSAEVEGHLLTVKVDFVIGKGMLDYLQTPYFHFQEYKPHKNPGGDPMAQLLEAFLIAQTENEKEQKNIPLYGCEIIGKQWTFVTMQEKAYCVSQSYNSTKRDELLQIIAILRKFKHILETRLLLM